MVEGNSRVARPPSESKRGSDGGCTDASLERFSALCCLGDWSITPDSVRGHRGLSWPKMGSHRIEVFGIFPDEQDWLDPGDRWEASGDPTPRHGWSGEKAPLSGSEPLASAA